MEAKENLEKLMEQIQQQELEYELDYLDEYLAMQMGVYIVRRVKAMDRAVATKITLNRRTLFAFAMDGTKAEANNWMRRKENFVYETNSSSYYWELWVQTSGHDLEWRGMSYADYAAAGGSFPIRIKGAGVVGAVTITGLASHEDHDLAREAVAAAANGTLDVDLSSLGLL